MNRKRLLNIIEVIYQSAFTIIILRYRATRRDDFRFKAIRDCVVQAKKREWIERIVIVSTT